MFLKRHILQYLFSSKAVRLLEYTYYYIEKEYHNIGKRPRDEELSKSFCLFEEVKLLLYNFTSCHVVKCFGFMIIIEQSKVGCLQVVVQGFCSILTMFEQLQGLSWILVHNRLLHGTSEIKNLDHEIFNRISFFNSHLKDLFFRGLAVAPMELMHS